MTQPNGPRPEYHVRIREIPTDERPRERLRDYGPGALATFELLAIILRVGTAEENVVHLAERLLSQYGGLAGLHNATFGEMKSQHGLGEAKAAQLQAALELGKRLHKLRGLIANFLEGGQAIAQLRQCEELCRQTEGTVPQELWEVFQQTLRAESAQLESWLTERGFPCPS